MLKTSEGGEKGSWSELRLNGSMPTEKDYQHTSRDSYEMNGSEGDVEVLKLMCLCQCLEDAARFEASVSCLLTRLAPLLD